MTLKRVFLFSILAVALFSAATVFAFSNEYAPASVGAGKPEVHIKQDGSISIKSGKVAQAIGSTFILELRWASLPMRFLMKTDAKTAVAKRYGGAAGVSAIAVGDYLDAEGEFFVGSDLFGFTARSVKNWSLQDEYETFAGVVVALLPDDAFKLSAGRGREILVQPTATTTILKGPVVIPPSRLVSGDIVLFADGVYDYARNILAPRTITVFQDRRPFLARNYEGVLTGLPGTALPMTLTVSVGGVSYRVSLGEKAVVQKKNREPAELTRFVAGDAVRFYGPMQEEPYTLRGERVVDAEVVRNMNL
jgi:hypothetical protein